jgi:subtilisin family serine protease
MTGRTSTRRSPDDFPAEYDLDNIIVVGAADVSGDLAYYSNYGSSKVDVIAPGSDVLSTLPATATAS